MQPVVHARRIWLRRLGILAALSPLGLAHAAPDLVGTTPPEWQFSDWLNSPPLKLSELRDKVVLIRWWTAPGCEYCKHTAPALNEFYRDYQKRGLVVIGAYHHKGPAPLHIDDVRERAKEYGFEFPVAIDKDWKTLKRWWLTGAERDFTSVSFLLDRRGVVQHIHPGGEYVKGDADYTAMKQHVEKLLVV